MSLSASLVTNEVKNAAGTEVEFTRLGSLPNNPRSTLWAKVAETPALPHRLSIAHTEQGSGVSLVRRSVIRVDITTQGYVDTAKYTKSSAYLVLVVPAGNIGTIQDAKDALAELTSCVATLATSTFLYDGTGNGAAALLAGSVV